MSALQWMTRFDHVHIQRMGHVEGFSWMHAFAWNVGDGGPTPHYFLIEREDGVLRVFKDLPTAEREQAMADPISFWKYESFKLEARTT